MLSNLSYTRPYAGELLGRLQEPRRFIQIISGARQVGKTTLIAQVAERSSMPHRFATADEPTLRGPGWIAQQWEAARILADASDSGAVLLIIDEVQKAARWAEAVKRLWDEDTRAGRDLRVVLSGSAPLLIERGLTESLAGRFERLHLPHWSFREMQAAFGWTLEEFIFYGAYPGAAPLTRKPDRWSRYIRDSLIETTIARDVLLLSRVDKPALLRRLFALGCSYSGQILSYTKMLGQLQDAGNTTTLAHYLDLLTGVGMLTGLQKYSGAEVRRRGSSPKLQVFNTALMTAGSRLTLQQALADRELWGRLVESAVGAHLVNAADMDVCEVFYWRDRGREVDFVLRAGPVVTAVEVKSGRSGGTPPGIAAFTDVFRPTRSLLVGGDGIPLQDFLSSSVESWVLP
ncbi:ATP-binding protein [Candidatus Palauibacter sp.]|uniref:ATP-binding protein n=1 Tax=Candidatus Palauibacter sp. TaxID=3101350 RepID=UPI003B028B3C